MMMLVMMMTDDVIPAFGATITTFDRPCIRHPGASDPREDGHKHQSLPWRILILLVLNSLPDTRGSCELKGKV